MAKKNKSDNWLCAKINAADLIDHGFTRLVDPVKGGVNNSSQYDEVYYFGSVDAVVLRINKGKYEGWYMALDSECDSFWQGDLKTMGDVFAVLILLSK